MAWWSSINSTTISANGPGHEGHADSTTQTGALDRPDPPKPRPWASAPAGSAPTCTRRGRRTPAHPLGRPPPSSGIGLLPAQGLPRGGSPPCRSPCPCWSRSGRRHHDPGIDSIRRTTPRVVALGYDFVWSDLACYAVRGSPWVSSANRWPCSVDRHRGGDAHDLDPDRPDPCGSLLSARRSRPPQHPAAHAPISWRGQDLGCMGNAEVRTPHLDRLASEGLLFRNTFANTPVCCPARANILTGKYAHTNGMVANDLRLRESESTIAEILASHGYRTASSANGTSTAARRLPGFVPPGPRRQGFAFWAANECGHRHFRPTYFRDTDRPIAEEASSPRSGRIGPSSSSSRPGTSRSSWPSPSGRPSP